MGLFALDLDYVPDFDKAAQPLLAFLGHHPKRPSHSEKKMEVEPGMYRQQGSVRVTSFIELIGIRQQLFQG